MPTPEASSPIGVVRFSVFEVDLRSGELRRNGTKVKLQDQPFRLLRILLQSAGEVVTRDALQRQIWPSDTFVDFDRGLNNAVKRLREALGDTADTPRYIETLPRRGYRFIGTLRGLEPLESAATTLVAAGAARAAASGAAEPLGTKALPPLVVSERTPDATPPSYVRRVRRTVLGALVATVVLAAIGVASNVGGLRDRLFYRSGPPIATSTIHSLAVIPLTSLSGDRAEDQMSDGITDELITELAQIRTIKVISRTSVMRYKKTNKPLPLIAHELDVDGIVEGTVQRSGDRIRISAQLIYGPADEHLWAKSFEYDAKDMLELETTIARRIAHEIEVQVTSADGIRPQNVRQVNPKALEAFLQARVHIERACKFQFDKGGQTKIGEVRQAYFYLDKAIEQDASYRPAYLIYFEAMDNCGPRTPFEFLPKAKVNLIKALELGDEDMDGHLEMAKLLMQYEYDWAGAGREYKRAVEVNPSAGYSHFAYSEYLANVGRAAEAAEELKLAQSLNPEHDYHNDHFAVLQRTDRTVEQQRRALEERSPNNAFVVMIIAKNYGIAGRFKDSVEMWERCLTLYGRSDFATVLRQAEAKGGARFALEEWMRAVEDYSRQHDDLPVAMAAFTYSSLGNNDRAFAWLDKAVEQRLWFIPFLKRDNVWNPIRSDPRFRSLLRRVGLPP